MNLALHILLVQLSFASTSFAAELPDLFSKSDGGFADAELRAQNIERTTNGNLVITTVARTGKDNVGFRVILESKWEPWKPQGFPGTLHRGTVKIETLGKQTEFFVRALAKAYAQRIERYDFTSVRLTAISLEGDPRKAETLPVRLKLFYESKKETEYAEVFLNLDLRRGVVQLHEKDPEYRKAVIRFFTTKNG